MKMPTIKFLTGWVGVVKNQIDDECRAFEGDTLPGIQLTVGWNPDTGNVGVQTGDNSYSGAAYGYPVWAVVGVHRRSNARKLAREIQEALFCESGEQELAADEAYWREEIPCPVCKCVYERGYMPEHECVPAVNERCGPTYLEWLASQTTNNPKTD